MGCVHCAITRPWIASSQGPRNDALRIVTAPYNLPPSYMSLYTQALIDAGFTRHQASVYSYLVENGPSGASIIARQTGIARTLAYRILDELAEMGLCEKEDKKGAVSVYLPAHPVKLHDMVERRKKEAEQAAAAVSSIVDKMTSEYNKTLGKPGVRFFEGPEGVEYVLNDSLKAEGLIYTYADIEAVLAHIPEINERYVVKREKLGKQKKVILLDSPGARKIMAGYHKEVTDAKLIALEAPPFGSIMEIYDNTISYVTLKEDRMIGVIIEDENITAMHKYLFEYMWEHAPSLGTEKN